ncbi:MAG: oxidoreductase [Chitinophaga sp.]|uniref:WD40/YVTN/BNR-like repeat-containing protein n=1 Tax=Chitinophaga sp. TaxID=1869181 RepID=UPI0025BE8294|nr:oxidoreductase [Chitinophaga sp.]MBV8251640.1 oxidoreductase [Chitinophaga sp.]
MSNFRHGGYPHLPNSLQWRIMRLLSPIKLLLLPFLLLLAFLGKAQQQYNVKILCEKPPMKSIRGLQAVNDKVVWVSGTGGMVGRTTNGGQDWQWFHIADSCDFRSIHAFDSLKAVVVSIASPALIYLTLDGGKHWENVYHNSEKDIFFDGLIFFNAQQGMAIGDPLKDSAGVARFTILRTLNGGRSWTMAPTSSLPAASDGEAIFAASNSSLITLPSNKALFVTGGKVSRLFTYNNSSQQAGIDNHWSVYPLPLLQGKSSTGAFSVAFIDASNGIIVGGDYMNDQLTDKNCFLTRDGGKTWTAPAMPPAGYKSAVTWIDNRTLLCTGTSGTEISTDGGQSWKQISTGYHTAVKARKGKKVYLAGKQIAVVEKAAGK